MIEISILRELIVRMRVRKLKNNTILHPEKLTRQREPIVKLVKGIRDGYIRNDNDAVKLLGAHVKSSKQFSALKSEVFQKLSNGLFFIETGKKARADSVSASFSARYQVLTMIFLGRVLALFGIREAASYYFSKAYAKSGAWELIADYHMAAQQLATIALNKRDYSAHHKYRDAENRSWAWLNAERELRSIEDKLVIAFTKNIGGAPEIRDTAASELNKAGRLIKKAPFYEPWLRYYNIRVILLEILGRYRDAYDTAEEARQYFNAHPRGYSRALDGNYALRALNACLFLGWKGKGEKAATHCLKVYTPGNNNRKVALQYVFLLHMHTAKPEKALWFYNTHREEINNPDFTTVENREKWILLRLYLAWYLYLQQSTGKVLNDDETVLIDWLHKSDIYQLCPGLIRDKAGLNIPLRILEFLYYLLKIKHPETSGRRKTDMRERITVLSGMLMDYEKNHLHSRTDAERTRSFIRMLRQLALHYEKPEVIRRKTVIYLENIRTSNKKHFSPSYLQEIIPYENLWELISRICKF